MTMNPNVLSISIADSIEKAPNYREIGGWKAVDIKKAVVVRKGMESGKATVDFQLEDEQGNKYIGMITGQLVKDLASVITGAEERDHV